MKADQHDAWLDPQAGPVALTMRQELQPALGDDAVFFPPTFAPAEGSDAAPDYLIDEDVALVDTVGSQANRMEPLFKNEPYASLVPQARVRVGRREVNLLDAGHRAADALVRFSEKWSALKSAFEDIRDRGDATKLARMAPTSVVFGAWDSRDTQAKLPRLVGSTIRAEGVRKHTRSAQFFSSFEKEEIEDLGPARALSDVGLNDAPSGRGPGGITASNIRRDAVLNLVALRSLRATSDTETRKLQRYILGLALVAFACEQDGFLREGCLLVPHEDKPAETKVVTRQGKREPVSLSSADVLEYAKLAAAEFGVGEDWTATFDRETAKASMEKRGEKKAGKTKTDKS
jgi:CRISPR-associated protein Csb1